MIRRIKAPADIPIIVVRERGKEVAEAVDSLRSINARIAVLVIFSQFAMDRLIYPSATGEKQKPSVRGNPGVTGTGTFHILGTTH
jgi:hypothetical protein